MRRLSKYQAFILVLLFLFSLIGIQSWFLFPPQEDPSPSDAVVVLANSADGRHDLGVHLVSEGISENFVVSNPLGDEDKVGFSHCRGDDRPEGADKVWCMQPYPVTTAGEAMTVMELTEAQGWSSITVVTSRPHTHRTRSIFAECTNLDVVVVPIPSLNMLRVPYHVAWEVAGYLKFWITNPCKL